jgi:hypothetical protein
MKRITIAFCTALILVACNSDKPADETKLASATTEEPKDKKAEWVSVDSATAEKNWMAYATPGEPHKMLAKMDGAWTGEIKMWMTPDGPPTTTTGLATYKTIMDGRYQESVHKSNMMGQAFEGRSTTAYDNAKKVFVSTWIDNMGTGLMTMEGTWDDATKTITYKGKMVCPYNGQECDMREVYKIIDDNTHYMEMYGPDLKTGKEYKNMEMTLKRKK